MPVKTRDNGFQYTDRVALEDKQSSQIQVINLYGGKILEEEKFDNNKFDSEIIESPSNMVDLLRKINDSLNILDYKKGWDDNAALPISKISFDIACKFLKDYSCYIYAHTGKVLITPHIAPVNNGSVDIEWTEPDASMLINFHEPNGNIAYYYGDFQENGEVVFDVNGQVSTNLVNEKFATYLSFLSEEGNS